MTDAQPAAGPAITRVEAIPLAATFAEACGGEDRVPDWLLHPAASHAVLPRRGQYTTLVRITAEDGSVGIGEAYGLPSPQVTAAVIDTIFTPMLTGRDALAGTVLWQMLFDAQAAGGHNRGFYMEALAGIDLALWDLRGKHFGVPVSRLLGGPVRTRIPCYASPVPFLPGPDESAAFALRYRQEGFTAIKVKVGRGVATDLAHLAAVREAVGADVALLVDANCAYRLAEATELADGLRRLGISWFEEPLAVDDLAALAELRRRCGLRIVNGETHFSKYDVRDSLAAGAVDVVMPNLARCGGFTEALRVAALADAHHVAVSPHGVGSGVALSAALQFMASVPNASLFEYNQLPNPLRQGVLAEPLRFERGELLLPTSPGLGFVLNEEAVGRYAVR